jgi:hypothetical protein
MMPNSAHQLVNIVVGTDYTPVSTTVTVTGPPTPIVPSGHVTVPGPLTSPVFALFCTVANTGNTIIRAIGAKDDGTEDITFPAGSFKQGVVYYIYLKKLVADGGGAFIGYKYSTTPVPL